jgi:hypothetical protein
MTEAITGNGRLGALISAKRSPVVLPASGLVRMMAPCMSTLAAVDVI